MEFGRIGTQLTLIICLVAKTASRANGPSQRLNWTTQTYKTVLEKHEYLDSYSV